MTEKDLSLISHLMRRAGFGASREEIESYASKDYEEIVEDLLNPERFPEYDTDMVSRYMQGTLVGDSLAEAQAAWMLRMAYSPRPLEERMTLFWHHVFASGWNKHEHVPVCTNQIETFRKYCMSDMQTILIELSKDPLMVGWLDNSENHRDAPNENYAREIMELFSMGVGNYSENDIKEAARAFTGWTMTQCIPLYPFGSYSPRFKFRADDHDYGEKTFLGETGNLDGYDIVDIIVKQPATARFIARHLYNFFVADEPQVPAWNIQPPGDPSAVDLLSKTFAESKGDLREVLRVLFNADFFKNARFKKIKSPVDLVVGTVKIAGTHKIPQPSTEGLAAATKLMGQALMDAPTVEGWHTGHEWVDSGTLTERVNFATNHMANIASPGIQDIIARIKSNGPNISPEVFLDSCLDLMGPIEIDETTRSSLMIFANQAGGLMFGDGESDADSSDKIRQMLQLVVSSPEYQFA
jgi:uncharacterized protein (DUF1800 family)